MNRMPQYNPSETPEDKYPFFKIPNEIQDIFAPLIGANGFAVYTFLRRSVFTNPELKHSIRDLAKELRISSTTVSRSLEILEYFELIQLSRGGSQKSKCHLLDSVTAAKKIGAKYQRRTTSWVLTPEAKLKVENGIKAIRIRHQGKQACSCVKPCENPFSATLQRDASVSPMHRQRVHGEMQTGAHLLQEEKRVEEVLSPTPFHDDNSPKAKAFPDEEEPKTPLQWAQVKFTGVMKDLEDHLLDTNRPPVPHLANGYAEWEKFGSRSLAVEQAAWRNDRLELTLSAHDPAAANEGLKKYQKFWKANLHKWYGDGVLWNIQDSIHIE